MRGRRKAREAALSELYQREMSGEPDAQDAPEASSTEVAPNIDIDNEEAIDGAGSDYAAGLLRGIREKAQEIDGRIEDCSENWSLARMAAIDRNLLRIAVFELLYREDVPYKVVIDEAVELAKKYGSEDSGGFINAILDRVAELERSDKAVS